MDCVQAIAQTQPAVLIGEGDAGLREWSSKQNVRLEGRPGGVLAMSVRTNDFSFGWMQRKVAAGLLPKEPRGLYGRFLAPRGMTGKVSATFIDQRRTYYKATAGALGESDNAWTEFYLPFSAFVCSQSEKGKGLQLGMVGAGDTLEITVGDVLGDSPILFEGLRFVGGTNEEAAVSRRLHRVAVRRALLPEESLPPRRPRLLMTPERLARVQAKVKIAPEAKAVYEAFLREAERILKTYPAEHPAESILRFRAQGEVNPHQWSGQLEGAVTASVIPIETLAAAYQFTGDERYGRFAAKALARMARDVDADTPMLNKGFYYTRTFYVRALAFGYDWLWPLFTPEERTDVKATLLGFVETIHRDCWEMTWGNRPLRRVWNWTPGLASCAGLGVLALEGETRIGEKAILFDLRRYLRDYLTLGLDPDGCGHEGPSYFAYGIGAGPQFLECLREQGRGDLFEDTNLKLIAPWIVSEILPDGSRWNNLSDCSYGASPAAVYSYVCGRLSEQSRPGILGTARYPDPEQLDAPEDYLWQFSERPGDRPLDDRTAASLMGWAWKCLGRNIAGSSAQNQLAYLLFYEPCAAAEDPARILPGLMHFRGRGLVVARTGYGQDDTYLSVEAGPHAAGHDQSDKGSFTFYAYGSDLAIDSGYGNDSDPAKSTSSGAHNIVLIDGKGQPMRGQNNSSGHITGLRHKAEYDWIRVDAAEAWNIRYDNDIRPSLNPMQVQRAVRQFCFVRPTEKTPPYLVVYDDICKDGKPADYTWLWHIPSSMTFEFGKSQWTAEPLNEAGLEILTTPRDKAKGSASFTFTVPEKGKYNLMGLAAATGKDLGKSDSFFIAVNGKTNTWFLSIVDRFFHWVPVMDMNSPLPPFELEQGGQLKVDLIAREPEAALAKLALIPWNQTIPVKTGWSSIQGGVILSAGDAVALKGSFQRKTWNTPKKETRLTVFPIATDPSAVKADWFTTTTQGIHPRLEHTVRAVNPHFLMVLVPTREGTPLPQTEKNGDHGVSLRWPDAVDRISFSGKEVSFERLPDR